jgi:hypothetical protein
MSTEDLSKTTPDQQDSEEKLNSNEDADGNIINCFDTHVCIACGENNLIEPIYIQRCLDCEQLYCHHNASIIDANRCISCLDDVSVTITDIKTEKIITTQSGSTYTKSQKAKQIKLGGMHWLFAQRKIDSLTDDQCELAIQYHRAYLNRMLAEREIRQHKNYHRNQGKVFKLSQAESPFSETVTTSQTTTKKTKTIKAVSKNKAILDMTSKMAAMGLSVEQMIALGNKLKEQEAAKIQSARMSNGTNSDTNTEVTGVIN